MIEPMDDEHKAFREHLDRASKTVDQWPQWKRTILGGPLTVLAEQRRIEAGAPSSPDASSTPGSATTSSTAGQPVNSVESEPAPTAEPAMKGNVSCRYNWVGDRMRERLDALEKDRPGLCHREYCASHRGKPCDCVYP